jgi:DNA-directed RNA polymerase specialized sigma24 family protein
MSHLMWSDLEQLSEFLWRRYRNSPDIVQETLLRVMKKMESGTAITVSLEAYSIGVATNVLREHCRSQVRFLEHTGDTQAVGPGEEINLEELRELVKTVLSATDRKLFEAYYYPARNPVAHRERLAARMGVSMGALYTRISRLKDQLERACQREAGKRSGKGER